MLGEIAKTYNANLVCCTESHLRQDIKDGEIQMSGFELFRGDRLTGRKKGGVIVYVREDWSQHTRMITAGSDGEIEYVILYIERLKTLIITAYRPPGCSQQSFLQFKTLITEEIQRLGTPEPTIVLNGDFNLPIINWDNLTIYGGTTADRQHSTALMNLANQFLLTQMINEPTRGDNILDLVFTSNEELVNIVRIEDTVLSDHRLIIVETSWCDLQVTDNSPKPQSLAALNFFHKRIDWDVINNKISSIDWKSELENKSSNEMVKSILSKLLNICTSSIPVKSKRRCRTIPRDRRILMKKRTRWIKQMTSNTRRNQQTMRNKLITIENKLTESHTNELQAEEKRAIDAIKINPKYFYSYARSKAEISRPIGPIAWQGKYITDPKEIADVLDEQYVSVYTKPLHNMTTNQSLQCNEGPQLDDIDFDTNDIEQAIASIGTYSAAGPDMVPAVLLKRCVHTLATPLCFLWRSSLDTGQIPAQLKHGLVTPIYKGGDRTAPKNYRPVGKTSHIIKVFERILVKRIREFMEKNTLFNEGQHGFRQGRSCLSQLLQHRIDILRYLEKEIGVDVVYLDFSKAFDKVDQSVLMEKLGRIGIRGKIAKWINNFFIGRTQSVVVQRVESRTSEVTSGVIQGSVIGPLLFLIFINDIDVGLNYCKTTSFADDTRMIGAIRTEEDRERVQNDLKLIFEWARNNNMEFNSSKFELMSYRHPKIEHIVNEYRTPDGGVIKQQTSVRDLGITLNDDATFSQHIINAAGKARQQIGWILRTFKTREAQTMLTLYKSLVMPLVEYCCQLWCPTNIGQIRIIEAVQRTFTSRIEGLENINYWERLCRLNLYSLERRRERYIIIYIWKTINNLVPNLDSNEAIRTINSARRGVLCIIPPIAGSWKKIISMKESTMAVYGPKLYNRLPKHLREPTGTLELFKNRLDKFLKTIPDHPLLPHYHSTMDSNSLLHHINRTT